MSANPLWLTLLSPALSFLALAVNVWITFRNWQRRPAAHWTCIPIHGKEGRADFNRFLKDANDDLEKSDGIGHMFALTNNGEMQAAGVKLFALGCSVQAIQYLDTPHGQAKDIGAEFAFVEPRGTVYALLDDPESKLFLDGVTPAKSGWFRVYWMDSPTRKPQYLKQDFDGTSSMGNVSWISSFHSANPPECPKRSMMQGLQSSITLRYMVSSNPLEENVWLVFCCVVNG